MTFLRSSLHVFVGVALTTGLLTGCGGATDVGSSAPEADRSETAPGPVGTVVMKDVKFLPDRLTIAVGEKVTWRNDETLDHNVVAETGAKFQSRAFGKGGTYSFTPRKPGTIDYVCTLHPGMNGRIVVEG